MNEPQFIPNRAPHVVEMPEGSHDAKSKSVHTGAEVQRTKIDSEVLAQADVPADRLASNFDHDSQSSTSSARLAVAVASHPPVPADELADASDPEASNAPLTPAKPQSERSHFAARLNQLKTDNDKVRAQLQGLESTKPTQV